MAEMTRDLQRFVEALNDYRHYGPPTCDAGVQCDIGSENLCGSSPHLVLHQGQGAPEDSSTRFAAGSTAPPDLRGSPLQLSSSSPPSEALPGCPMGADHSQQDSEREQKLQDMVSRMKSLSESLDHLSGEGRLVEDLIHQTREEIQQGFTTLREKHTAAFASMQERIRGQFQVMLRNLQHSDARG